MIVSYQSITPRLLTDFNKLYPDLPRVNESIKNTLSKLKTNQQNVLIHLISGCENLRVIDGCWKLCIPHGMLAVPMEVLGVSELNFPDVCTNEPQPNSVFCEEHYKLLTAQNIPTTKREFLQHIGCAGVYFYRGDFFRLKPINKLMSVRYCSTTVSCSYNVRVYFHQSGCSVLGENHCDTGLLQIQHAIHHSGQGLSLEVEYEKHSQSVMNKCQQKSCHKIAMKNLVDNEIYMIL